MCTHSNRGAIGRLHRSGAMGTALLLPFRSSDSYSKQDVTGGKVVQNQQSTGVDSILKNIIAFYNWRQWQGRKGGGVGNRSSKWEREMVLKSKNM